MSEETNNQTANLGCGTFIIIALIVAIFSSRGDSEQLRESVDDLSDKVVRLEHKIDLLSKQVAEKQPSVALE
jgi:hypothetical protein